MSTYYTPSRLPWKSGHVERITVTLDHMFRGVTCDGSRCAVALAVTEHFAAKFPGTEWTADVGALHTGIAVYECDSGTDQWSYTHNANSFINEYDEERGYFWRRRTVMPFELELRA